MWGYRLYGLHLRSNRALAGLPAEPDNDEADIAVDFAGPRPRDAEPPSAQALYASPGLDGNGIPYLQAWRLETALQLRYSDGDAQADYHLDAAGTAVRVTWSAETPPGDIASYLLGPVMGCALRLRGTVCLHAGALAVGAAAILIAGPQGAGKSTLTAALAERGCAVLTDDIAPLFSADGACRVQPGYPRLRMWQTTLGLFADIAPATLPRALSKVEKYYVDLTPDPAQPGWKFHPHPLPVAAIYVLGERGAAPAPEISPLPPAQALFTTMANAYADYILEPPMRARDFYRLGQMAGRVAVKQVARPDALDALPALCDLVLADVEQTVHSKTSSDRL